MTVNWKRLLLLTRADASLDTQIVELDKMPVRTFSWQAHLVTRFRWLKEPLTHGLEN
ncbi:unnamed protein product [Strongylus vulgaris]|uniref:Uncharacterized protein n=1 Tax=Strongylus vulgaris TaxID=40348 RepID=A0A3P7JK23_STRVU|nr:unnamed protein product [Strongylus vulgaris]